MNRPRITHLAEIFVRPPQDPALCHCDEPVTDADLGDLDSDGDDWCWRCHRSIQPDPPGLVARVLAFLA